MTRGIFSEGTWRVLRVPLVVYRRAPSKIGLLFAITTVLLLAISFFSPCLQLSIGESYYGWACLMLGWGCQFPFPWLANPAFAVAALCLPFKKWKLALSLSLAAMCFALMTFFVRAVVACGSGATALVIGYDFGFHVWFFACIAPGIGALLVYREENRIITAEVVCDEDCAHADDHAELITAELVHSKSAG